MFEKSAETSGVKFLPVEVDSSCAPETLTVALRPGDSKGRAVRMSKVEPIPPEGTSALPLLSTRTELIPSDAKLPKSNERPRPLAVGI